MYFSLFNIFFNFFPANSLKIWINISVYCVQSLGRLKENNLIYCKFLSIVTTNGTVTFKVVKNRDFGGYQADLQSSFY